MMTRLRRLKLGALSLGLIVGVTSEITAEDGVACEAPRFLLHLSQSEGGIEPGTDLLLNGTPLKVFEGEPFEWSHYAVAPLPCEGDDLPVFETGDGVVAGVFVGRVPVKADSRDVPANCDDPVYLLGLNTVTDETQYRIYASALSGSDIAPRHGFVRLFGRTPNPLLEGAWPDNTTATLSIWPCAEAFDVMYESDWYRQDILPLREDSARYRLMTFRPAE